MAEAENEAAFLSSMQAMNESAGGYSNTGDASGEQIDSSDEYDPAQEVQDDTVPGPSHSDLPNQASSVPSSNNPSRPASAQPHPIDSVQTDTVKSSPDAVQESILSPSGTLAADNVSRPASTVIAQQSAAIPLPMTKARLPHDKVGILEDRIKEDEKGDVDAWLDLIEEHKARGKIDDARKTYERFLAVFPQAADQWVALAQLHNEANNRPAVEDIFSRKLKDLASLSMWSTYLNHIRRHFNMATDKSGDASQVNHLAYEAVLDAVGIDKDAGQLWLDYIQFIKSSPGVVGGTTWQDQQKMDLLRKAYQRAVCVPTQATESIWKEYSNFEMSLNKLTGRKFLQERSPDYMSARAAYIELQNITRDLNRTTLPSLPPALHFEGDEAYARQVDIWKNWIHWEKSDPLTLKDDNLKAYKDRIIYVYKQALMALFFWPEMWFDAAEFCFENDLETEGESFLSNGIAANPESSLLAFKQADRLELTTTNGNDDESKAERGNKVRAPYDFLLEALYSLMTKVMDGEARAIANIEAEFPETDGKSQTNGATHDEDENDDEGDDEKSAAAAQKKSKINMIKTMHSVRSNVLVKSISHAWIALMRAMQRMQGKGKPGAKIGGSRQIFTDARKRGRINSEVWIASALLEFHNTDSESAKRIFERGMKLFPEDENYALEYIKLLTNTNDNTNARVVFEKTVDRLLQKPETSGKAKSLFAFFHRYESQYGELSQVIKLEKRMKEAFPDDPRLGSFSQRYVTDVFDPTAIRPIISPATQARPKGMFPAMPMPTVEQNEPPAVPVQASTSAPAPTPLPAPVAAEVPLPVPQPSAIPTPPTIHIAPLINSPKRPLPLDDTGIDPNPPRKLARGESPLAGAAGRRLNQAKQNRQPYDISHSATPGATYAPPPPPPIPRDVLFLLSIIPPASTYQPSMIIPPEAVVQLMRQTNLPPTANLLPPRPPTNVQGGPGYSPMPSAPYPGQMQYPR